MEYVVMWFGTIAVSKGMEIVLTFDLFKSVADLGYKIDQDRLKKSADVVGVMDKNLQRVINLIPICNMFYALFLVGQYCNNKDEIMENLRVMDCLEEMTELEKEMYNKKRTGLNAIKITADSKKNKILEKTTCGHKGEELLITDCVDDEEYTALIEYTDDSYHFIIKEVRGSIENLSSDEQKEKIKLFLKNIVNRENSINEKKEQFEHVSKKISEYEETKETDEKSTKEKWQDLRQEILEYTEKQKENNEEKGRLYTKK